MSITQQEVVEGRISRAELYMQMARLVARRSTCKRGQVGCVAVRENRLVAAGYNGAPTGMKHCLEVGCGGGVQRQYPLPPGVQISPPPPIEFPNGCTRAVHAELNMVAFAARHGTALEGCTVYATAGPCLPCAQALVTAGIGWLYYETPYRLPAGLELIDSANIPIVRYEFS